MEFIGLLIDRINDELVVLNNSLTDRELTTDFYLREYDLLYNHKDIDKRYNNLYTFFVFLLF